MKSEAGFEEVNHTGDRAIQVWAPDMSALLQQAALGMYAMLRIKPGERRTIRKQVAIRMVDDETLLFGFLSELLSLLESERFVVSSITLSSREQTAEICLDGYHIRKVRPVIKAVTYHDLQVVRSAAGLRTTIVFDV